MRPLRAARNKRRHGRIRRFRHRTPHPGAARPGVPRGGGTRRREEDESDFEDLIGFEVEAEVPGTGTVRRGTIAGFLDHEANPLFELDIDGRTALVPAVEEFVARIDFEGRTVHFVLPEGLLELE